MYMRDCGKSYTFEYNKWVKGAAHEIADQFVKLRLGRLRFLSNDDLAVLRNLRCCLSKLDYKLTLRYLYSGNITFRLNGGQEECWYAGIEFN